MKLYHSHDWNLSAKQAIALQKQLSQQVIYEDQLPPLATVAGVDVGFEAGGSVTRAAIAVLSYPQLQLIEQAVARQPTRFPYIPGLLSFRELPAVLEALASLQRLPDIVLCDGQGIAHPRRFGIACHLGVLTGLPAIGVGKTRLTGRYQEPGDEKGAWSPLLDKQQLIGAVLRTRQGVKPLFISQGHRVSLPSAISIVLACTGRYKLPETTRWAHRLASG